VPGRGETVQQPALGKMTIDTGWARRVRPLGPFGVQIAASAGAVFDVIADPYLGSTLRAMAGASCTSQPTPPQPCGQ
jgi:hypothetical protein